MGDVLEAGVVLAYELLATRWRDKNAGREVSVFVDGETVAKSERVRIKGRKKVGFGVLTFFQSAIVVGKLGWREFPKSSSKGAGRCKT